MGLEATEFIGEGEIEEEMEVVHAEEVSRPGDVVDEDQAVDRVVNQAADPVATTTTEPKTQQSPQRRGRRTPTSNRPINPILVQIFPSEALLLTLARCELMYFGQILLQRPTSPTPRGLF